MSIEKSPAPTANAIARTDSKQGVKAKGADGAADDTGKGFTAILGAMGDTPTDAVPASDSTPPDLAGAAVPAVPAFDVSLLLQQNPQIAAAQAASAAAAVTAGQASAASNAMVSIDMTRIGRAGSSAIAGAPASLLPAGAQSDPALPGLAARRPAQAAEGVAVKDAGTALVTASDTPEPVQSLTQGLQHAGVHARSAKESLQAAGETASSSTVPAGNERVAADKFMAALEQGRSSQGERAPEPLFAPLLAKQEKPEQAGFSFKTAEPTYSGTTLGVSAPDFSQSGAPAPVMAPEMQVAEQVSYWVSHNVQNAELKLDGLGQSPVQVSISVQGNEAQISFRTDEAATRGMLEAAGGHLKDMLQREGLVLTGVSVGSSGSGDAGGGERRSRQNVRQGVIAPLQVASADSAVRLRTDAGRSVDLFV